MIEVDKDEYVAIVKTSVGGEDKYEVMYSLGLVYINDEKRTSNSPDISGPIRVPTGFKPMKFAGWKSEQKDGREGTSVSITEPKEKNEERFQVPNKKRYQDRAWVEWVSRLPCMLHTFGVSDGCSGGVQAHHLLKPWDGSRGLSLRSNDRNVIPLCFKHHSELHDRVGSEPKFFIKYGLDPDTGKDYAQSLYNKYK